MVTFRVSEQGAGGIAMVERVVGSSESYFVRKATVGQERREVVRERMCSQEMSMWRAREERRREERERRGSSS